MFDKELVLDILRKLDEAIDIILQRVRLEYLTNISSKGKWTNL